MRLSEGTFKVRGTVEVTAGGIVSATIGLSAGTFKVRMLDGQRL